MTKRLTYLVGIIVLAGCATVAVTGRRQLSLVSNEELLPMSFESYKQVLDSANLSSDQEQAAMIQRVGVKIQKAVEEYMAQKGASEELEGFAWDFNLIDDDIVNAWCMPGGKVAFYTGIMPICRDEVGVAVVMGHEVAHAIANHGRERMSQGVALNFGLSTLGTAMGEDPSLTQKIFMQSIGAGSQIGMLKFSRVHESEADRMGLIFMSMAGYLPDAAPKFWERMAENSGGAPPEWLSTHPSHDTRIQDLKANIPEAMEYYKK